MKQVSQPLHFYACSAAQAATVASDFYSAVGSSDDHVQRDAIWTAVHQLVSDGQDACIVRADGEVLVIHPVIEEPHKRSFAPV